MKTFKFRLYPNLDQKYKLQENLDICRWIYNKFVEHTKKTFLTRNDMNYILTELKQSEPWLYNYHNKMLQMTSTRLEAAEKSLIEQSKKGHKIGNLKFAKYNEFRTFTYNQTGFKIINYNLHLSKIGIIKIRKHREVIGTINQVTIRKTRSGKWYACITCEVINRNQNLPKINLKNSVGIDVGIKSFAYDSDNNNTPNPLNLKKILRPLARTQRKVSRRKKGSNNRRKAILRLQKMHEKIMNRRNDFHHKLSAQYAKNYDVVFVEKLEKTNMLKNRTLARSIMDSSWGKFLQKLEYKCKLVIQVSPKNTSVECCNCGSKVPKSLEVRIHRCNKCKLIIDRDYNASINILQKGLKIFNLSVKDSYCKLPQELREVTPVEISSVKQEIQFFNG